MKIEINTDKMVDNVVSEVLEREIDGKTIKQWMTEIAKHQRISVHDKMPITEKMHLEKEWFKEARNIKSIEELSEFVDKMLNSYQHDYGTTCHAIAACSAACAWLGAEVEGITGFQAGFIMWDFIRNWMYESNACGLRIIDYDNFLYPQYEDKFDKAISEETWASIQKEAKKLLDKDDGMACSEVRRHWENIVNGVVPFGYHISKEL